MKKVILLMVCAAVLLAGCAPAGSDAKNMVENTTKDSWSVSYDQFDGAKTMEVPMVEGQGMVFAVEIETESGELGITITGADGTEYYTGKALSTTFFTVKANPNGPYTISVEAKRYSGSFAVSWEAAA